MNYCWEDVHKICEIEDPLNWDEKKSQLFLSACRTMAQFHYDHSPQINWLYKKYRFHPDQILTENSLSSIPLLSVTAMKYHLLTSLPHNQTVLRLTSSGTKGQKTQIWFDQKSLDRVQRMMDVYLEQEGFISDIPQNYLVFNYNPDQAGDLGTAFTEKNQLRFAPVHQVHYAISKNKSNEWFFDKEKVYEVLCKYETEKHPIRIFALPAFLFEFIEYLKNEKKKTFKFSTSSWILTGGGWKASEDKQITREEFREICFEVFGIPLEKQRDAFGMAEHCAPYFQCRHHQFHIAAFNRILIRDPKTLEVLPKGQMGLMELITPFNAMMPTIALLSTDYGKIHLRNCSCGFQSPTFEIIGRAGIQKHKGCALSASEIVRKT